jgi:hypothetical protein
MSLSRGRLCRRGRDERAARRPASLHRQRERVELERRVRAAGRHDLDPVVDRTEGGGRGNPPIGRAAGRDPVQPHVVSEFVDARVRSVGCESLAELYFRLSGGLLPARTRARGLRRCGVLYFEGDLRSAGLRQFRREPEPGHPNDDAGVDGMHGEPFASLVHSRPYQMSPARVRRR